MKGLLPVHFYIPKNSLPEKGLAMGMRIPDIKKICEDGVSGLWFDSENGDDTALCTKLTELTSASVVPVINRQDLIPVYLKSGVSGIAVKPSMSKKLLRYKDRLSGGGICVYLRVDENDFESAGGPLPMYEEIKSSYTDLKDGGIRDIFINAFHSDTIVYFNINRRLKTDLGSRHVISTGSPLAAHPHTGRGEDNEPKYVSRIVGLGCLFYEEIGDIVLLTLSQGLSATYRNLRAQFDSARKVLGPLGFFPTGITVISCPTCGRCSMDLVGMAHKIDSAMKKLEKNYNRDGIRVEDTGGITVAVMGCNVNGPGEARNANLGIAGRKDGSGVIFKNGRPFKSLPESRLVDELVIHTKNLIEERLAGHIKQK
jgi:hypothetical protein